MGFVLHKRGTLTQVSWSSLNSLAASATAGRMSPAIDNTTLRAVDMHCGGVLVTGATPVANQVIDLYGFELVDGTNYLAAASGSDGALTPLNRNVMRFIKSIAVTAAANSRYEFSYYCQQVFGGMPIKHGLWVNNNSGFALNAANNAFWYTPLYYESVDALP